MTRLAGTVYDAAHDGNAHRLDAAIVLLPLRHPRVDVRLDLLGHQLKERRRCAPAARACRDLRFEAAQTQRLQDLSRHSHLFGPLAVRPRGERHPDRVADSLLKQDRERARAGDNSFHAHAGFGKTNVERIVASGGESAVDLDEVLDVRDLRRNHDAIMAESDFFREPR